MLKKIKKRVALLLSAAITAAAAAPFTALAAIPAADIEWNFSTYSTQVSGANGGKTESYNGLSIYLADSKDYIQYSSTASTNGIYFNGKNGYVSYTPEKDGTLVVSVKSASESGNIRLTDADGNMLANGNSDTDGYLIYDDCIAGTTYKIVPAANYQRVRNVKYYYSADDYTSSFAAETAGGLSAYVNAPSDYGTKQYPLVVFLGGTLAEARGLLKPLMGSAILAVAGESFTADTAKTCIAELRSKYNAASVIVAGFGNTGAAAGYAIAGAGAADRIMTIAGAAGLSSADAKKINIPVWVFSSYADTVTAVSGIRADVNTLQSAGANALYTEYPFCTHDHIVSTAGAEDTLAEWIAYGAENAKTVDLVLFAGQSNMAGRGDYADATVCPPGQGYEYHSVTDALIGGSLSRALSTVNEPFGKYENNSVMNDNSGSGTDRRNGDMVSSVMKAYYDATGVPIVGVQASRGGQKTSFFLGDSVMSEMQSRYNEAEAYLNAAGYTVRKKFMVWCQGCSDADSISDTYTTDNYKTNTLSIFGQIREATGITDVFMVRIGHRNNSETEDAKYYSVNRAQGELIESNDFIHEAGNLYSDYYYGLMRDQYHYYQPAYNSIGATVGANIAAAYAETEATYKITGSVSGGVITATVTNNVKDGIIAYVAQYDQEGRLVSATKYDADMGDTMISESMNKAAGDIKILLWDDMEPVTEPYTVAQDTVPAETESPEPTAAPTAVPTATPAATEEPAAGPEIEKTWKFDFGAANTAADGYIPVTKDMVYSMSSSSAAAEGEQYGFLGTTDTSYADDVLGSSSSYDNRAIDGFTLVKGQRIDLTAGGTASDTDPDTDYIAAPARSAYVPGDASAYEGRFPVRFAMKAQNASYYTVTAKVKNVGDTDSTVSLFSEKRKYIALDSPIKAGETLTFKFSVDIETIKYKVPSFSYADDILNVCVSGENAALTSLVVERHKQVTGKVEGTETPNANNGTTMWIVTDSTACDYGAVVPYFGLQSYGGVGQAFPKYLPENISVVNEGTRGLNASNTTYLNYCDLKEGDYLYLEYGHNHSDANGYYSCLQTYYDKAAASGAYFIIGSPINRHNSGDFDPDTNMWKEGFTAYSEKALQFVKEKIDEGAENIAFVNLNAVYTDWMNEESARINTLNPNISKQRAMDFYYYSVKGNKVDGTHLNDAGADQGAYAFFTAMQRMAAAAEAPGADKYTRLQAAVIKPLISEMKTTVGGGTAENKPMQAPETVILAGAAPNSYWDTVPSADLEYVSSAAVESVTSATDEGGNVTITDIALRKLGDMTYAKAVVEVTENGSTKTYYTEYNYDCTGDEVGAVIKPEQSGFLTSNLKKEEVTDAYRVPSVTVPNGAKCVIRIVEADDNWQVPDGCEVYSVDHNVYPEVSTVFSSDEIKSFDDGTDLTTVSQTNKWAILSGAAEYSAAAASENGEKYIHAVSSGGGKNYGLYKALDTPLTSGRYRLSFKTRLNEGGVRFALIKDVKNGSNPFNNKTYAIGIENGSVYAVNTAANTLDITYSASDSEAKQSVVNMAQWVDADCIIDLDLGTIAVSVGGSEYKSFEVSDWRLTEPATTPLNYFGIAGSGGSLTTDADIKDIRLVRIPDSEKSKVTVTASANAPAYGTVAINGSAVSSAAVDQGTKVTFSAEKKSGYKFVSWTDKNGAAVSSASEYTVKVYDDLSLTANFEALSATETEWDFAAYSGDGAIAAAEDKTVTDNGMELHLANGDSMTASGLYWSAVGTTKDNAVLASNRYIKYTPSVSGTLQFTVSVSSVDGSTAPRLYMVSGSDTSCMYKSNPAASYNAVTAADTATKVTYNVTAGTTYYFWTYYYNRQSTVTISDILFKAAG